MRLDKEELEWFGVWAVLPTGECACPRGVAYEETSRDQRAARPGSCPKPGKHPWVMHLESGDRVGFPHGFKDAVSWDVWSSGLGRSVLAGGGRAAVAVPGSMWVLDADNALAWRALVRLVHCGAIPFDRVLAADTTPRGMHVWVRAEIPGWRTGAAQKKLNELLQDAKIPRGLEVKSGGGYVVAPDGITRHWMPLDALAERLTWSMRTLSGWGSRYRIPTTGVAGVGAGEPPKAYAEKPPNAGVEGVWEDWDDEQRAEWSRAPWNNLLVAAARLHRIPEGSRNIALNRASWIEGRAAVNAGWERSAVEHILIAAGVAIGLPEAEVRSTVRSGLKDVQ